MKRIAMIPLFLLMAVLVSACSTASSQLISPDNYVSQFIEDGAEHILIDVRTPQEFAEGHIAGSVNIPFDQISFRLDEIPTDMPVVVYCRSGNRSAIAARTLVENDYSQVYDMGGILSWTNAGYPVE